MSLKANVYMTFSEIVDWLKIDRKAAGLEGDTKATKVIQDLTYTSVLFGTDGNSIQVEYLTGGTAGSEVVTVTGQKISVQIEDIVSTAAQIKAKVDASAAAMALVSVAVTGTGTNAQTVVAAQTLSGGLFHTSYKSNIRPVIEQLMNSACSKVESIIKTPVLGRTVQEDLDGSDSNVVKPTHWPIIEVLEMRIDYNRKFPVETIVPVDNYFLRGSSDLRQNILDQERVIGTDIVLRDDNEKFIIGRIFSGSVLGAIRVKYITGWGKTGADVPDDIRLATTQLIEYWWLQRENRDINVHSKGVKGESYTKLKDGIPESILEMLELYEDFSLGDKPVPQRNYYRL